MDSVMEALRLLDNRLPERMQTDNGSDLIPKSLDKWGYESRGTMSAGINQLIAATQKMDDSTTPDLLLPRAVS